jgi:phage protein U
MAIALMSLGDHKFYVPLPQSDTPGYEFFVRDTSYVWIPQGRLNKPLAWQYTGAGEDVIIIEGKLFPHHFGGISTMAALRQSADAGKVMQLIRYYPVEDGNGGIIQGITAQMLGSYMIRRVKTAEQKISSVGLAHKIDFSLELAAYGDDNINLYNGLLYGTGTAPTTTAPTTTGQQSA